MGTGTAAKMSIALVISPLWAVMLDQKACFLHSGVTAEFFGEILSQLTNNRQLSLQMILFGAITCYRLSRLPRRLLIVSVTVLSRRSLAVPKTLWKCFLFPERHLQK